jgi:transposase
MATPKYPELANEEWLRKEYIEKNRLIKEIAEELGCSNTTVSRWLNKHGIKTRSRRERIHHRLPDELDDPEWLREKYHNEGLSCQAVAEKIGCSDGAVLSAMNRHGIETRSFSEAVKRGKRKQFGELDKEWLREEYVAKEKSANQIADETGTSANTVLRWLHRHDLPVRDRQAALIAKRSPPQLKDGELLQKLYVEERHSPLQIASKIGTDSSTVARWLIRHNIEPRGVEGEDNPNWTDGETSYGDGWNKEKREQVRERDNFKCRNCGIGESEHIELFGQVLHVHHIVPASEFQNAEKRNRPDNLLTVCARCHQKIERLAPLLPPSTRTP